MQLTKEQFTWTVDKINRHTAQYKNRSWHLDLQQSIWVRILSSADCDESKAGWKTWVTTLVNFGTTDFVRKQLRNRDVLSTHEIVVPVTVNYDYALLLHKVLKKLNKKSLQTFAILATGATITEATGMKSKASASNQIKFMRRRLHTIFKGAEQCRQFMI